MQTHAHMNAPVARLVEGRDGLPSFPDSGLPVSPTRRLLFTIRCVAVLALGVTLAYLIWRTTATLDLRVWWVSLPLLLLEIHAFIGLALFTFSLWDTHAQPPAPPVLTSSGRTAVLIPTYNEGIDVLLPTIAAAVALQPAHETWVLDDGGRPEVADLARELGARYLVRPDNLHAKAGNINHALTVIDADFIAVLDADHVPTPNFLINTLGYFADPRVAVVQTPQDFYNLDSFEHGKLTDDITAEHRHLYHEQALFYRVIQPAKNRWGAAFWCGTNAVVRMTALREIGGIATETITEDIHTTIRLHRRGWKTVYHNEVLARGLAAASADQYQLQRYRWGTGAMQLLRRENPLVVSGLSVAQRLAYAKTLLGWFDAWRTLGYLLIPAIVLFSGASPIAADFSTFLGLFLAGFLIQRVALRLLSRGYYDDRLQMVFELARMTPNLLATLTLLRRTPSRFQVTPKGRVGDARELVKAPALLYGLLAISAAAAAWFGLALTGVLPIAYDVSGASYGAAFWLAVNACFIVATIRRIKSDAFGTERRAGVRFDTELPGYINDIPCTILDLSLSGARIVTPMDSVVDEPALLTIDPLGMMAQLTVEVRLSRATDGGRRVYGLAFTPQQYRQRGRLALALFNRQCVYRSEFADRELEPGLAAAD